MCSYKIIDSKRSYPEISIAMLAYNHEKYISKAIESILIQKTEYSYKIIIAEDYSTDKTRSIVLNYQRNYPEKIKLILQDTNVGAQQNNLDLLSNLEGKYIALLEGDDYWIDPLKLQKQVDFMKAHSNVVFSFHGAQIINNDGSNGSYYKHKKFLDQQIIPKKYFIFKGGGGFCTASCMFKKEMINPLPIYFKSSFIGDLPLALAAIEKGDIGYLSEEMAVYRIMSEGSWSNTLNIEQKIINNENVLATVNSFNHVHNYKYANELKDLYQTIRFHRLIYETRSMNMLSRLRIAFGNCKQVGFIYFVKFLKNNLNSK